MNIKELGALIKNRRESRNLTLENVSQAIKIPVKSLTALEDGDLEYIKYETYYKNFLKCYVRYLGFTNDEYQDFLVQTEEFSEHCEPPKSLETQHAETHPEMSKPRGKRLAIQLFVLAVIGGSAYFYFSHKKIQLTTAVVPTPVEEVASIEESKLEVPVVEQVEQVDSKKEEQNLEAQPVVNTVDVKEEVVKTEEKETLKQEEKTEIKKEKVEEKKEEVKEEKKEEFDVVAFEKQYPTAKKINWEILSTPKEGENQAVLYATQDCWMQYTLDGKKNHFILKKDAQKEFIFKKNLKLRIANGSAITLFLNKKPVNVGDSSQMRYITLP